MYCQRDKALGNSSLYPTSHPSQPMHSHSAIFTLAFRLPSYREPRLLQALPLSPPSLSLSLSSLFPPSRSLCPCCSRHIAVANACTRIDLLSASEPTNHRLAQFKNTEQERKSKNKALIDGNKRHRWGLNRTVIWRFFVPVGDGFLLWGQGFPGPFAKVKTKEAVGRETRSKDATQNPSLRNLREDVEGKGPLERQQFSWMDRSRNLEIKKVGICLPLLFRYLGEVEEEWRQR